MIVSKQRKNLLFKLIMLAIEVYQVYHTKLLLNFTDIRFIFKLTRHKISNILSTFILRSIGIIVKTEQVKMILQIFQPIETMENYT